MSPGAGPTISSASRTNRRVEVGSTHRDAVRKARRNKRGGYRPSRILAMHELTVAANRFSDAETASCVGESAETPGSRRTAATESQSLSLASADSFSAASKASVNLSDMIRYPMLQSANRLPIEPKCIGTMKLHHPSLEPPAATSEVPFWERNWRFARRFAASPQHRAVLFCRTR
jgi:hypothetical protein